jgi:thiamine thiazole synthase
MTKFDDIVIREKNRVGGVVINWSPISSLPPQLACVDPIALESKVVMDATGHDAQVVKQLELRGLIKTQGCGAMWIEESEDLIVEHTREVHPGLVVVGMAVSATYGVPRMGPTFGSMLLSGQKGADIVYKLLKKS